MTLSGSDRETAREALSPLLRANLRPPANPDQYLHRPRLMELLDEAARAPITVVHAAGSGKTSLLVDWCASSSIPTAWLSLDENDRDGGQFWTSVSAALSELDAGLRTDTRLLGRAGSPADAVSAGRGLIGGSSDDVGMTTQGDALIARLSETFRIFLLDNLKDVDENEVAAVDVVIKRTVSRVVRGAGDTRPIVSVGLPPTTIG